MEASTLRPAATLPKPRITVGAPLLRLRSDEQLVALFRSGHDEAFHAIHDRYHRRLFAYARQMLPARQDAEDVLQDVFVRAYAGLRASGRDLALRAWLFRVAHNRCVDQLRKPSAPPAEVLALVRSPVHDPLAEVDMRESLRRLVDDIRRLPDQQRSALLMRELAGLSYADLATSLGISVGAVKSLLVRARLALAQAAEARETACTVIREQLVEAHDRGLRPNATARRHMRDCACCKSFRRELRGVSRQLAAVAPAVGPLGFIANLLGFSGGGGAAGGAGGGAALLSGGGTTASAGGLALGTGHVATLIVAAVATAGGTVELQRTILPTAPHAHKAHVVASRPKQPLAAPRVQIVSQGSAQSAGGPALITKQHPAAIAQPTAPAVTRANRRDKAENPVAATKRLSIAAASAIAAAGTSISGSSASSCGTNPVATTAPGGTTSTSTASSTTPATTTGSAGDQPSAVSSSSPPPPAPVCGSNAGSSSAASGTSGSSSPAGASTSGTNGSATTSTGSNSGGAAGTAGGAGSLPPSSNTTSE